MSNSMQLPNILVNKVSDETQEISMISDVLEPHQSSQSTVRFVIPPKGTILDSMSSFIWRTEWSSYDDSAKATECVVFKDFSGSLNTIKRCRLFVGQKLLMQQEHSNIKMFMDNRFEEADNMCEIHDCRFGAMNDYFVNMTEQNAVDVDVGQMELGRDAPSANCKTNRRFTRKIGSGKLGWESQLFLSDLFGGLKDLSLPLSKMKEAVSIEIDFNTSFDDVFYDATSDASTRIPSGRRTVAVNNPRLLCDYIQYDQATDAALESQIQGQGVIVPFRECVVIERTLNATTSTSAVSQDIPMQLNGKALMKIMVQKLVNTGATKDLGAGKKVFCGESRSDALPNESYNLIINDLLLYDQPVDTDSQKYAQLSQVGEKSYYAWPEGMTFKDPATAYADADFLANRKVVAGHSVDKSTIASEGTMVSTGQQGTLGFLGISLGLYGKASGDTLASAAYRVGSSPVLLRYSRSGGSASTFQGQAVKMRLFVDILRVMDLNAGFTSVRDQ